MTIPFQDVIDPEIEAWHKFDLKKAAKQRSRTMTGANLCADSHDRTFMCEDCKRTFIKQGTRQIRCEPCRRSQDAKRAAVRREKHNAKIARERKELGL